jgi:flagellar basal-body rod protein FlgF
MESLDMLANNLANASTSGFKMDHEYYTLYSSEEAAGESVTMPEIGREWTDLRQGTIQTTGKPLDLAIDGKGFFVVSGPSGPLYTRNGSFRVSSTGAVQTQEGHALQLSDGRPLRLNSVEDVSVGSDGTVMQKNLPIGKLKLVDVPDTSLLVKEGAAYFRASQPGNAPATIASGVVRQGALEGSNVNTAESAVRMIGIMRQFEMLQRAISIGSEMNRKAAEEVARL